MKINIEVFREDHIIYTKFNFNNILYKYEYMSAEGIKKLIELGINKFISNFVFEQDESKGLTNLIRSTRNIGYEPFGITLRFEKN